MPRIQTFDAGTNLGLQPSEVGVESMAAAARRQGAFYNQQAGATREVGQTIARVAGGAIRDAGQVAVDYLDHQQISHGAATFAELTANKTDEWNNIVKNADPNDPSVSKQFLETSLEPALDKFRQGFMTEKGQAWAEHHIDTLRQHFFEKTASDMSSKAKKAVTVNTVNTVNQLSNTVYNDPSALDFSLKTLGTSFAGIANTSPTMRGTDAAAFSEGGEVLEKAREQLVKSAALGYIEKTGQVPPWASSPQYSKYINGIELKQFQKAADAQQRANIYYEKQTELLKKQQADNQAKAQASDFITNNFKIDPDNPNRYLIAPDAKQKALDFLRRNHEAPSSRELFENLDRLVDHASKPGAITSNPQAKSDFWTDLANPDVSLTSLELKVLRNESNGQLTPQEASTQRNAIKVMKESLDKDPILKTKIDAIKERVGFELMANGKEQFSNAMAAFLPVYERAKRSPAGLPPNALDLSDPSSLISQSIKAFEPNKQDRMMAHALKAVGLKNIEDLQKVNVPGFNAPPAQPPANATPAAMKLPPLADRKKGQVYPTPSGHMRWTGTGWTPP